MLGAEASGGQISRYLRRARRPWNPSTLLRRMRRLLQHATGYLTTMVNGEPITENGKLAGAYPGLLVRG